MNVSLELTKETAEEVSRAAAQAGKDVPSYLQEFVKRAFAGEKRRGRSIAEILAPFRAEVERSGASEEQLDAMFTDAREKALTGRRGPR